MKHIIFFYILKVKDLSTKKTASKGEEETKTELLQSIFKERSEDLDMIDKPETCETKCKTLTILVFMLVFFSFPFLHDISGIPRKKEISKTIFLNLIDLKLFAKLISKKSSFYLLKNLRK